MWNCEKSFFLFLLLNTSGIVSVSNSEERAENEILSEQLESNVCMTELCVNASKSISQYIDYEYEPCDNFYKFACGNFETVNEVVSDGDDVSDVKQWYINGVLETFLESTTESELKGKLRSKDLAIIRLAKSFLMSCKDNQTSEKKGIQPIVDLIKEYGGWPVVEGDSWDEENWNLIAAVGKMSQDGLNTNSILTVTTIVDDNGNKYLTIQQPKFYIDKVLLLYNYEPYLDFMVNISVMFNADESDARIQMDQALDFERQLAEITNEREELLPITIQQLQRGYPYWDWLKYIRSVLPDDVEIDESSLIVAEIESQYFMHLEVLLKQTRKRTIANFLIWRMVLLSSLYLNEDLNQRRVDFFDKITNKKQHEISRYDCIALTKEHLAMAISTTFFIRFGNQNSKIIAALKLANNVRNQFVNMLHEVDWIDNETKYAAINKADNMNILIARRSSIKQKIEIEKYYDGLELSGSSFFENVLHVLRFEDFRKYRKIHEPVHMENHLIYHSHASLINAFYYGNGNDNSVYIPPANLVHPFFVADLPNYLNYGSFGQTIGHEITHGFDNSNHGVLIHWSRENEEEFSTRANCYKQQYSKYGYDSSNTIDDDIADNGGVKAAYRAYQYFVARHGAEALLPGLDYTQQQLFWISAAQSWCSKDITRESEITTDDSLDHVLYAIHSPNQYRVIGMFQNMPEFARDFKCSPGSKMNPIQKCDLW